MEAKTIDKAIEQLNDVSYSHVRLKGKDKSKLIVPFNSRGYSKEKRIEQIETYIKSEHNPDGIYFIEYLVGSQRNNPQYIAVIKDTQGELSDEELKVKEETKEVHYKNEQDIISNKDLLSLQVENERLKIEAKNKDEKISELEAEIELLEEEINENEEKQLADKPATNWMSELKDVAREILPTLADSYFQDRKEERKIKEAKLGLEYQKMNGNNNPQPTQQQLPSYEELMQFKEDYPQDFYRFYNENKDLVDNIINEAQEDEE